MSASAADTSFGGAAAISAGSTLPNVKAVVPMSSQRSRQTFAAAGQPKELKLFAGNGHGIDEPWQEIVDLLIRWIPEQLAK